MEHRGWCLCWWVSIFRGAEVGVAVEKVVQKAHSLKGRVLYRHAGLNAIEHNDSVDFCGQLHQHRGSYTQGGRGWSFVAGVGVVALVL